MLCVDCFYALAMDPIRLATTDRRAKAIVGENSSSTQPVMAYDVCHDECGVWRLCAELAEFPRAAGPLIGGNADVTSGWVTSTVL